jgi:hypothetical protein
VGAAIETQLAIILALMDCLPRNWLQVAADASYGQGWSSGLVMVARMRWVLDVSFSSSPDQTFRSLVGEY